MPMLAFASPYILLHGLWVPSIPSVQMEMSFQVTKDLITSISDHGSLSMRLRKQQHEKEDKNEEDIVLNLYDLEIIHKPVDWYNLSKYANHIRYMKKIRRHGIHAHVFFTSTKKDQILIKAKIGEERLPPFLLERKKI
jgi:hypothetical protein